MSKEPKIGLALGGGGARGIAHIGALKVLEKEGIKIDYLSGVSMGSFIGACYVAGISLEEMEKEALSFNKKKAIKLFLDIANPKRSLIKGVKVANYIRDFLKNKNFEDTKIPFKTVATDLSNGKEVVLDKGSLANAVRASIGVPGIFPPVKIGESYLVDGGIVNCTPVDLVEKMGADIIIGVDLIIKREIKLEKAPGMVTSLVQSFEIIRSHGTLSNIKKVSRDVILIKPHLRGAIDSFKFYDIDKFIDSGERAAREAMPEIKRKIESFKRQN